MKNKINLKEEEKLTEESLLVKNEIRKKNNLII